MKFGGAASSKEICLVGEQHEKNVKMRSNPTYHLLTLILFCAASTKRSQSEERNHVSNLQADVLEWAMTQKPTWVVERDCRSRDCRNRANRASRQRHGHTANWTDDQVLHRSPSTSQASQLEKETYRGQRRTLNENDHYDHARTAHSLTSQNRLLRSSLPRYHGSGRQVQRTRHLDPNGMGSREGSCSILAEIVDPIPVSFHRHLSSRRSHHGHHSHHICFPLGLEE
jgi:hypothetical protein